MEVEVVVLVVLKLVLVVLVVVVTVLRDACHPLNINISHISVFGQRPR